MCVCVLKTGRGDGQNTANKQRVYPAVIMYFSFVAIWISFKQNTVSLLMHKHSLTHKGPINVHQLMSQVYIRRCTRSSSSSTWMRQHTLNMIACCRWKIIRQIHTSINIMGIERGMHRQLPCVSTRAGWTALWTLAGQLETCVRSRLSWFFFFLLCVCVSTSKPHGSR